MGRASRRKLAHIAACKLQHRALGRCICPGRKEAKAKLAEAA